jgi:hypothetical protein
MRGADAARRGLAAASFAAALLLPASLQAAEPYEGAWARTAKECKDPDGATSLTIIGLDIKIDGKTRAMVEQYENHCFIDKKSTSGNDTTLNATCYEFWDDFKKKANPRKATIKLSQISKDALKIDGASYRRCPEKKDTKKKSIAGLAQRAYHQERNHPEDDVDQREHEYRVVAAVVVDQAAAP